MLPAELPLSLARAVVPAPPAMANDNRRATSAHQGRTPHVVLPAIPSNALVAHTIDAKPLPHTMPTTTAQDQAGNAAVASAALRLIPMALPTKESRPGR